MGYVYGDVEDGMDDEDGTTEGIVGGDVALPSLSVYRLLVAREVTLTSSVEFPR